jgi:NYN domain
VTRRKYTRTRRLGDIRRGRTLILVDIENLACDPRPQVESIRAALCRLGLGGSADQVVTACNHGAALTVAAGWPCARHLVRSGPDGADDALLDIALNEDVARRFDRVVLATGDGAFAPAAAALAASGVTVVAVSHRHTLSARLRLAVHEVWFLDSPPTHGAPAQVAA